MFPELFEARMKALLGEEYAEFLASYDRPRNVGLRINPLKTDPACGPVTRPGYTICRSPAPWPRRALWTCVPV